MIFKEGQIFIINSMECCLLGIVNYESAQYGLFSAESNKLAYLFYQIIDNGNGYDFVLVEDNYLNCVLLNIYEESMLNEE